jgi:HAD superfamily hydrolase (TIGR01509 family)
MSTSDRKAVFFDLDGTLLDTNYLHVLAWWKALDEAGERRPMASIHRLIGMGGSEFQTTILGREDEDIATAHGRFLKELQPLITPLPGAQDLVRRVKAVGGLVVMVTSANHKEVPALLETLGVQDAIDAVVGGEDAERAKPHPDLFALALAQVDLTADAVVALGDTVWDVEAAGRAGVGCVGVTTGGIADPELRGAGALAVYRSCTQLLEQWPSSPMGQLFGR